MPKTIGTARALLSAGLFSPANVSPAHWYRSTEVWQDAVGGTPAVGEGDPIGEGEDLTANQDHVNQAVAGNKPTLRLNVLNGLPVMRFDGTADYLQGAFTNGGALAQPFTVFAVAQLDASVVNDDVTRFMVDGDDATNRLGLYKTSTTAPDAWGIYAGTGLLGSAADTDWNIWTGLFNGVSSQFWHNGISEASGNAGAHQPDGISIGTSSGFTSFWKGDIAEIIIYAGNLPTADKNQVGSYLGQRYGIVYTSI